MLDTAGLTYAEYARSGFWQLLAVAALTFAVIAAARRWAPAAAALLLTALCLLTLVVLASALKRLGLLEETYGFTRLRFAAHAALFYLGGALRAWCSSRARRRGCRGRSSPSPPRRCSLFALADPERRIAEHNVDRYERTGKLDVAYLADAGRRTRRRSWPASPRCRCRASTDDGLAGLQPRPGRRATNAY